MPSNDNVIEFPGETTLDIPPERVLDNAPRELDCVLVLGLTPNKELYTASSTADIRTILYILEKTKFDLLCP